ncbi:MAG: hypothetical protein ABUL73_02385 [Alphaproteobacteria bacterium]
MTARSFAFAAILLIASCGPQAATTSTTSAAPSFSIGTLADSDAPIQGCSVMLSRAGAAPSDGDVFRAGGDDDKTVQGFIRIDGALITLGLVNASITEKGGARTFADAQHATQVVETLTTGEAHEEADSVDESGTLAVTHNGATETLQVTGGTAC